MGANQCGQRSRGRRSLSEQGEQRPCFGQGAHRITSVRGVYRQHRKPAKFRRRLRSILRRFQLPASGRREGRQSTGRAMNTLEIARWARSGACRSTSSLAAIIWQARAWSRGSSRPSVEELISPTPIAEETITLEAEAQLRRCGGEIRLLLDGTDQNRSRPVPSLVGAVARANDWVERILLGAVSNQRAFSKRDWLC